MRTKFRMIIVGALLIGLAVFLGQMPGLAVEYNEAPMLRTMVAAGELPPVEQRLPDEPVAIKAAEGEIGVYGGSMIVTTWPPYMMTNEYLIRAEPPEYLEYIPNVVKAWEINEDTTEVTFFLRKGLKWSDGELFTADDFMFWYNDMEGNKDLTPIRRAWYTIGKKPGVISKIDDYTVKWTFIESFGSFIDSLYGQTPFAPAHYLKQFHADYVSAEQLTKTMKEGGFDTWMDLFGVKNDHLNNPERPVIRPWIVINEKGSPIQIWERNPYYWRVDPKGNQLPYIDHIEFPRSAGVEADLIRLIAGEFDLVEISDVGGLPNWTIVLENQEKGNYRTVKKLVGKGAHNIGTLMLNVHHKDPAKRELFNNLDFRKALSVALNRQEIIDIAHRGIGLASQVSPATGPPYHGEDPEFKEYYTQYDPELANQLLDGIGLTERDNSGYRLGPDGKKLLIILQVISGWIMELPDMVDMYKEYFQAVGLNTIVKPMPEESIFELVNAVEHDIFIRYFAGGDIMQSPANGYLFPRGGGWHIAPKWARWIITDGEKGEEPPDWVKRLAEIDNEAKAEVNADKRVALYNEAVLLCVNELMPIGMFGIGGSVDMCFVLSNRIRNVPDPIAMHLVSSQLSSWYILEKDQ